MNAAPCLDETEVLSRVTVRLLRDEERPEFDRLLKEQHYLHDCTLVGESLRYVAELDGQWVALLAFSAAALHLKAREAWLGWSPRQRARRLTLVANNSRFLVLPERHRHPNLASRVLALCLRGLSADWERRWHHPVLVVESFVDEAQYKGTCYRACGFAAVGPTQGCGRSSRDFYLPHGQPKQLYLRELQPGGRRLLRQPRWPESLAVHEAEVTGPCPFRAPALTGLLDRLATLQDTRRGHGLRHRQRFVLACGVVSTLMGACGYRAFENTCKKFTQRQLKALGCQPDETTKSYVPPSDSTFQRVFAKINADQVAAHVGGWLGEQEIGALTRLAVDGKVLRGSGRHDGQPLQLLAAVTHHLRLTLGQIPSTEKSNEIPALKPLLEKIRPLPGTLLTADALHCQQESARLITQEWGGDYLFGLKGNQSGILETARRRLALATFPAPDTASWEKGHGRLERRRVKRVAVTPEAIGLCGCWQVIAVLRETVDLTVPHAVPTVVLAYYATSLSYQQYDGDELGTIIRDHWSAIETGTNYRRDVTLGEDACRTAGRQAAAALASLRNLANGIYELAKERGRTTVDTLKSWCAQQTFTTAMAALKP
jgi:predicted transposase YbfD/YdcC